MFSVLTKRTLLLMVRGSRALPRTSVVLGTGLVIVSAIGISAQTPLQNQVRVDFAYFESADAMEHSAAFYDLVSIGCPSCEQSAFPVIDGSRMRSTSELLTKMSSRKI